MALPSETQLLHRAQIKTDAIRITLSASPGVTAVPPGFYFVIGDVDCHIKQGDGTVAVTATTGHYLPAKTYWAGGNRPMYFSGDNDGDDHLAAVGAGAGTLELQPLSK